MEIEEALEAMEACEPQANLYMAAEEYAEEQAYDFKGVCDVEDYKELAELMKQAVIYGAHWKEQQMMKDAVEGYIERDKGGQLILGRTNLGAGDEFMLLDAFTFHNIKCGDRRKAKIMIVIKED